MSNINTQVQEWAHIKSKERFCIDSDGVHVKHCSKLTFWDFLTGKARLSCVLTEMNTKIKESASDLLTTAANDPSLTKDLRDLRGRIQEIQENYYKKHNRLYIWLFGSRVKTQCKKLQSRIDGILNDKPAVLPTTKEAPAEEMDQSHISSEASTTTETVAPSVADPSTEIPPEQQLQEMFAWFRENQTTYHSNRDEYDRKVTLLKELIQKALPPEDPSTYADLIGWAERPITSSNLVQIGQSYAQFLEGSSAGHKRKWLAALLKSTDLETRREALMPLISAAISEPFEDSEVEDRKAFLKEVVEFLKEPEDSNQQLFQELSTENFISIIQELEGDESLLPFLATAIGNNFGSRSGDDLTAVQDAALREIVKSRETVSFLFRTDDFPGPAEKLNAQQFIFTQLVPAIFSNQEYAESRVDLVDQIDPQYYFETTKSQPRFIPSLINAVQNASYDDQKKKEILERAFDIMFSQEKLQESGIKQSENVSQREAQNKVASLLQSLNQYQQAGGDVAHYLEISLPEMELSLAAFRLATVGSAFKDQLIAAYNRLGRDIPQFILDYQPTI